MIRHPDQEQQHRLSAKTLDQVFIKRAQEGLGCSLFEAQALTDLVLSQARYRRGINPPPHSLRIATQSYFVRISVPLYYSLSLPKGKRAKGKPTH